MSWSVSAKGIPQQVQEQLNAQFTYPLAPKPAGLVDDGERETVGRMASLIKQVLTTFDPKTEVTVSANGHMAVGNIETGEGRRQEVNLFIR